MLRNPKSKIQNPKSLGLLSPAIVALLLWMIVPLAMTLWFSFQRYNLLNPDVTGFAGLANYKSLLTDSALWTAMLNTLILVGSVLVVTVVLGTLLAVDARVLLLDEPTGGVAQREAEAFGPLIVRVQRELGAAMLVIEHDMPLIMGISDRVYCLEAGSVIAEGTPAQVRHDPSVIASYLGTDERAIRRSGVTQPG